MEAKALTVVKAESRGDGSPKSLAKSLARCLLGGGGRLALAGFGSGRI